MYQKWVNSNFCSLQYIQQVNLDLSSLQWILQSMKVHVEANLYHSVNLGLNTGQSLEVKLKIVPSSTVTVKIECTT